MRAALLWCGTSDPCDGVTRVRAEADDDRETLAAALALWHSAFGDQPKTSVEALRLLNQDDRAVLAALASCDPARLDARAAGNALRRHRGRIVGGLKLVHRGPDRNKVARWGVAAAGSVGSSGVGSAELPDDERCWTEPSEEDRREQ